MSHSRSKGHRQQHTRHQEPSQEWNQSRTPSSMNYAGEGSSSNYGEQERYGGQGGYRSINYSDRFGNPRAESEFQGSREYREDPRYGQQQWRSSESGWRPEYGWRTENRREEEERMPRYREGQPEPDRQRSNVTRFGQRREVQSGSPTATMPGRQSFAGRGPQGYKRSDERITEDINEELTQDSELDASDVNIEVHNGEVILKGTVPDRESKRRAEEIAECCSGVKDVMNQLRIKRDESSESETTSRRDRSEDKRNKVAS